MLKSFAIFELFIFLCTVVYVPIPCPVYLFSFFFFFNKFIYLFLAALGLRCGAGASHCSGFSCCGAQALGARASVVVARGPESAGSVVVVHGLSCPAACGIFPDQGSNPCPLHWQADC